MDDSTTTGKVLGQITNLGLNLKKGVTDEAKKVVKSTVQQGGFENQSDKLQNSSSPQAQTPSIDNSFPTPAPTSPETKDFVNELYGVSPYSNTQHVENDKNPIANTASKIANANPNLKPEDVQKLASLRHELHQQLYYQPIFNRPKSKEEPVTEKLENEKQQEMMELQEKEKKKPQKNLALDMAQKSAEVHRGASG